jgi:hypothetical protein
MKFFKLNIDWYFAGGWGLGEPNISYPVIFKYTTSGFIEDIPQNIICEITKDGKPADVTFTTLGIPIISHKISQILPLEEVQLIPIVIKNSNKLHYILLIKDEVECIDEKQSMYKKFDNSIRPDLAGQYWVFMKLKINTDKIGRLSIFRVRDYNSAIIINENIKNKLENIQCTGITFEEVP